MPRTYEGKLAAAGMGFGVVVSRWNAVITDRMLEGALDALVRHGADPEKIEIARVPGAWEIPVAAQRLANVGRFDAVVCIGCLIRGETPHFEYLSSAVTGALAQLSVQTGIPVTYGVITVDSLDQAIARAGSKAGNKGAEAAMAAVEMADVLKQIDS